LSKKDKETKVGCKIRYFKKEKFSRNDKRRIISMLLNLENFYGSQVEVYRTKTNKLSKNCKK